MVKKQKRVRHVTFEVIVRGSAPSKEAQQFAKRIMHEIEMMKRRYFPDTTIGAYGKLGKLNV